MGKIKAMAKYRLSGRGVTVFVMFITALSVLILMGNFSFLSMNILDSLGITFVSVGAQNAVCVSLCILGIILLLTLFSPIRLGLERWFLLSAGDKIVPVGELFYYFTPQGLVKSIKAVLFCVIKKTAAFVLFVFPSFCLFAVLYFSFGEGEISLYISYALFGAAVLLFLIGMLFWFIYTARYFVYYGITVSNEKITPQSAFEKSLKLTEGAYLKICLFKLSFLPWLIPCMLVFPAFYVWGYYKEAKVMMCVKGLAP